MGNTLNSANKFIPLNVIVKLRPIQGSGKGRLGKVTEMSNKIRSLLGRFI